MAINLIPFDQSRPMSDTKAPKKETGVNKTQKVAPTDKDRSARTRLEEAEALQREPLEQKASKPNRRRRKSKKQEQQQDDYGLYTNHQTDDHHLVEEQLEEPEHKVDIEV